MTNEQRIAEMIRHIALALKQGSASARCVFATVGTGELAGLQVTIERMPDAYTGAMVAVAKADEGDTEESKPLTQYERELAELRKMFGNGCPHCPSNLPPDPADGRCGMCGALLVERKA